MFCQTINYIYSNLMQSEISLLKIILNDWNKSRIQIRTFKADFIVAKLNLYEFYFSFFLIFYFLRFNILEDLALILYYKCPNLHLVNILIGLRVKIMFHKAVLISAQHMELFIIKHINLNQHLEWLNKYINLFSKINNTFTEPT